MRVVIKIVVDMCYFGICYIRWIVCFVCEFVVFKNFVFLKEFVSDGSNCCLWGYILGIEEVIIVGDLLIDFVFLELLVKGIIRLGVFFGEVG